MNSRLGYLCGKQKWRCHYCKRQMTKCRGDDGSRTIATIDEVRPRSKGGRRTLNNQVAACKACNNLKGSLSLSEFEAVMARPDFWDKIGKTNSERRQAKKDRKEALRSARAEADGRWSADRLPRPPADLESAFKASLGEIARYKPDAVSL